VNLPAGFRVELDADTKWLDDTTLFGGTPARVLRLSAGGRRAWAELRDGPVTSAAAGALARRLTDSGVAHPRPPSCDKADVTVVVPVRDRAAALDRCLASLTGHPVVVVDDGSVDPTAVAAVVARHGATLVRRDRNGGPAAARNTGLAHVGTELVAFLDSDCVAPAGWIGALAAHFADPLVAAVAPRIVAEPVTPWATSLDLGSRPARVLPGSRVAYVPTAALVVRRAAIADGFDTALRYGEDVDLVWRLHEAGGRVRYDPTVQVTHHEPETWQALLVRRFHYGTSAGPLALRHPAALAPVVLPPWATIAVAGLLARRPVVVGVGCAGAVLDMTRSLRAAGLPTGRAPGAVLSTLRHTWLGVGRYTTQFAAPALVVALATRRGRLPAAALLLGPPLVAWASRRPAIDPARFVLGSVADDIAYGAGVLTSCVRARTTVPLRPRVLRIRL
jgi:mycofactocin system glycosyltransferase